METFRQWFKTHYNIITPKLIKYREIQNKHNFLFYTIELSSNTNKKLFAVAVFFLNKNNQYERFRPSMTQSFTNEFVANDYFKDLTKMFKKEKIEDIEKTKIEYSEVIL